MAPSVATTWKPTTSVGCDLAVSRHLQRSVIALLSGGTRIALTSTHFLTQGTAFQTAYFLLNQHGTNIKIASHARYDMSPDIPWSSARRQLRSFPHK